MIQYAKLGRAYVSEAIVDHSGTTHVPIWMSIAAPEIARSGPQKSFIECAAFTWHTSPNLNETPVIVIVIVKNVAAIDHPKPCAQ